MNDGIGIIVIALLTPACVLFLGYAIVESGRAHRAQKESES